MKIFLSPPPNPVQDDGRDNITGPGERHAFSLVIDIGGTFSVSSLFPDVAIIAQRTFDIIITPPNQVQSRASNRCSEKKVY